MSERVVIITGAAGGVGRIVTKAWLDSGASVVAVDASDRAHESLREFVGYSDRLQTHVADLTTEEGARSMVSDCRLGIPDALVHLVGGFTMGSVLADNASLEMEKMLTLNLRTSLNCFRAVLPGFRQRGGGWIVAMGSKAVNTPGAQMGAYAASKAALVALAQSTADEFRAEGIHVNLLMPATIDTPANRAEMGDAAAIKWVRPEDVAAATLFLCSEHAHSIHGATLEMYGLL
jgi:NAD(P)-dependent dehydrogenase (short-subunit alcohol dehydrogenase family)